MNTTDNLPSLILTADAVPVAGDTAARLVLLLALVLLNGVFLAADYAIQRLRGADIDDPKDGNNRKLPRIRRAREIAAHPEKYLSATRMGVTTTTLLLGVVGAPMLSVLVSAVLVAAGVSSFALWLPWLSIGLAFVLILSFLVVVGELVPKSIGIRHPLATVTSLSGFLKVVRPLLHPLSAFYEGLSGWTLTRVFRIEPVLEGSIVHSSEELQALVSETGGKSDMTDTERGIVIKALELSDLNVRDIMVPRSEVVSLDVDHGFEDNLKVAIDSRHTRFPLVRGHMDNTIGLIHIKDILKLPGQDSPSLMSIKRDLLPVPEKMPLDQLLQFFLREHAHLALVVDEFGGTLGVVFLDNVLEELVGDIHDEFDEHIDEFHRISDEEFFVDGSLGLYELAEYTDVDLESADVSTIGGYVTHMLGHVPRSGEKVGIEGYTATITKTDGRRVVQLHFRRQPDSADGGKENRRAGSDHEKVA